jgi:hypothetical protein
MSMQTNPHTSTSASLFPKTREAAQAAVASADKALQSLLAQAA